MPTLKLSLERSEANKQNIILAGDFNCPNNNWEQQTAMGPDREIQQELADLMSFHNLTQVHNQPTREGNLLDHVFVSNTTLVKSSTNVPGISDHDIITDMETYQEYQTTTSS
jgi:endonuclease/exonuclease/phosphatase family metal-dependent hydrolase